MTARVRENSEVVSFSISKMLKNKMDERWKESGFLSRSDYVTYLIRAEIEQQIRGVKS